MPSWKELKRFCERDGWELYKSTDHDFYRKIDENGNLRFIKVSRGTGEIKGFLWKEILKKQLCVTEEYFKGTFLTATVILMLKYRLTAMLALKMPSL